MKVTKDNRGLGVIEVILIAVVVVGLLIVFRPLITEVVESVF